MHQTVMSFTTSGKVDVILWNEYRLRCWTKIGVRLMEIIGDEFFPCPRERLHAHSHVADDANAYYGKVSHLSSAPSLRRSQCTYIHMSAYALPALPHAYLMITWVCICVPLPLLRVVRDFCEILNAERNSEHRRNIDKCASANERWGTQRWMSQRLVAAAVVSVSSKRAGFKNAVLLKLFIIFTLCAMFT